jgi:hypothetical protein
MCLAVWLLQMQADCNIPVHETHRLKALYLIVQQGTANLLPISRKLIKHIIHYKQY